MPRRNRPRRARPARDYIRPTRPLSFEAMARELVLTGVCSPLILEQPLRTYERNAA
jgi:hypothetical protein